MLYFYCFPFFRPDIPRPIRVNTALPVIFIITCVVLVLMPSLTEPKNLLMGLLITAAGIPFYYLCVSMNNKSQYYNRLSKGMVKFCQLLFNAVIIEADDNIKH